MSQDSVVQYRHLSAVHSLDRSVASTALVTTSYSREIPLIIYLAFSSVLLTTFE